MTWPADGPRRRRAADRPIWLLALLVLLTMAAACAGQSGRDTAPAASPPPPAPATAPPPTPPAATPPPSGSGVATGTPPQPIRELHQGDRLFGVYWVAASPRALSPVERRLRALGYPASSGELDCDEGARRWLGVPATVTSRVAVYFGTEQGARAFAQGVPIRPGPHGHAAAVLYCLD